MAREKGRDQHSRAFSRPRVDPVSARIYKSRSRIPDEQLETPKFRRWELIAPGAQIFAEDFETQRVRHTQHTTSTRVHTRSADSHFLHATLYKHIISISVCFIAREVRRYLSDSGFIVPYDLSLRDDLDIMHGLSTWGYTYRTNLCKTFATSAFLNI